MKVDAHHHFWHPKRGDYGWMPPDDPILTRQYNPADLAGALDKTGVAQTILVQAAPTVEETEYLLGVADCTPHVGKVVGWVNFEQRSHLYELRRLAKHPKFAGVRPMIQDIADDDWMLRDDVQWAFEALSDLRLSFDCLGFPRHLDNFHTILTRYPDMRAVIDHGMKPDIENGDGFDKWAQGMQRLADDTQAFCKISGLVTEAGMAWTVDDLRPYTDHILDAFGPNRVMWGSDWPVCRLRCEYEAWYDAATGLTAHLNEEDKARVFGGTAAAFYELREMGGN